MRTEVSVIPGGLTRFCQPLDIGINNIIKSQLRNLYVEGELDSEAKRKTGNLRDKLGRKHMVFF